MDRTTQQEEIKAHLMQSDEHFRKLVEQHREYDRLVNELERKTALSVQEEVEEHRLKKLKLHLRDEMERIVHEHALQHAS
jgi:uncharacterized protein YdcH (DUF465 family)